MLFPQFFPHATVSLNHPVIQVISDTHQDYTSWFHSRCHHTRLKINIYYNLHYKDIVKEGTSPIKVANLIKLTHTLCDVKSQNLHLLFCRIQALLQCARHSWVIGFFFFFPTFYWEVKSDSSVNNFIQLTVWVKIRLVMQHPE